jgi:hypothetical protein
MIPTELVGSSTNTITAEEIRTIVREELAAFKENNNG